MTLRMEVLPSGFSPRAVLAVTGCSHNSGMRKAFWQSSVLLGLWDIPEVFSRSAEIRSLQVCLRPLEKPWDLWVLVDRFSLPCRADGPLGCALFATWHRESLFGDVWREFTSLFLLIHQILIERLLLLDALLAPGIQWAVMQNDMSALLMGGMCVKDRTKFMN